MPAPKVSDCSFVNNTAAGMGGAIYNTGTLTVNYGGPLFTGNTAEDGGAIYNATGGTATLSGPELLR